MEKEDGLGVKFTKRTKLIVSGFDVILLILIFFHFIAADLPDFQSLSNDRLLILSAVIISIIGFGLSFRYDGVGGLIILYGFLLFWIVNFVHDYHYHLQWITGFFPLSGIMHIFVWRRMSKNISRNF